MKHKIRKHKIRTTMRPDQELEVTDRELLDLDRQGLLLPEGESAPGVQPPPPSPAPTPPPHDRGGQLPSAAVKPASAKPPRGRAKPKTAEQDNEEGGQ